MRRTKASKGWRARRNGNAPVPVASLIPTSWLRGQSGTRTPLAQVMRDYLTESDIEPDWVVQEDQQLRVGTERWMRAVDLRDYLGSGRVVPTAEDDVYEVQVWVPAWSLRNEEEVDHFVSVVLLYASPLELLAGTGQDP